MHSVHEGPRLFASDGVLVVRWPTRLRDKQIHDSVPFEVKRLVCTGEFRQYQGNSEYDWF